MKVVPLCCESIASRCSEVNKTPQCFTAHVIAVIIGGMLSLAISIMGCFILAPVIVPYLIVNMLTSMILIILGINYLINQSGNLKNYVRNQREINKRNQQIEFLNNQVMKSEEQIVQLESKVHHLNKYIGVLEQENTTYCNKYLAEVESSDKYEQYVRFLSTKLQETFSQNNSNRKHRFL